VTSSRAPCTSTEQHCSSVCVAWVRAMRQECVAGMRVCGLPVSPMHELCVCVPAGRWHELQRMTHRRGEQVSGSNRNSNCVGAVFLTRFFRTFFTRSMNLASNHEETNSSESIKCIVQYSTVLQYNTRVVDSSLPKRTTSTRSTVLVSANDGNNPSKEVIKSKTETPPSS
jgi:hypothetical protein